MCAEASRFLAWTASVFSREGGDEEESVMLKMRGLFTGPAGNPPADLVDVNQMIV